MLALTLAGQTRHLPEADRDDAMRQYWDATRAGDPTARLVRLVEAPVEAANGPMPDPDPDDDPPPAAPAAPAPPAEPGTVSELAVRRIRLQEEWLAKAGFALAPPLYAPGTRVLPLGDANFRVERRRAEALPPFPGASSAVIATVRQEARRDLHVPLGEVAMTERGALLVGGEEHALEVGAFYQLAQLAGFGMGARYLAEKCGGELRAENVNAQFKKAKGRVLTLRTRAQDGGGDRAVYAAVTPAYAPVDTDRVLSAVAPALADARAELVYDGSGARATALWMPDEVVDLAAGDVFKAGVRVETDDTGRGRVRISAVVFRNRCLNLIVIGEGSVETVSAVHKGSPDAILAKVAAGVEAAREKIADFLAAWGRARSVKVDPEVTIRQIVEERRLLPRGQRDVDAVVEAILAAWRREPGDTLADAANALTRAAHETPTWGMDFREELERQAARLVLVPR